MKSFNFLLVITLLFSSCKKESEVAVVDDGITAIDTLLLTKKDMKKITYQDIAIDAKANAVISNWQAYLDVANGIQNLSTPDFSFFTADVDLFNSTVKDLEETIPEAINTQAIKARVLVLKTMLLKFQEIEALKSSTKKEKLLAIRQVFFAQSNLNLQINKKIEKDNQTIVKPF